MKAQKKIEEEEIKEAFVVIRFTEDTKRDLLRHAKKSHQGLSSYIRGVLLDHLEKKVVSQSITGRQFLG